MTEVWPEYRKESGYGRCVSETLFKDDFWYPFRGYQFTAVQPFFTPTAPISRSDYSLLKKRVPKDISQPSEEVTWLMMCL